MTGLLEGVAIAPLSIVINYTLNALAIHPTAVFSLVLSPMLSSILCYSVC